MTLLHTQYGSGARFTAGAQGGTVGISGVNDITGRINFGGYDFPQTQNVDFTVDANLQITQATWSGTTQYYQQDIIYNGELNPIVVINSGASIGSTVTHNFYYATGSGTSSTGSIVAGSVVLT